MVERDLEKIARLIRYWILVSTTRAGSGHPTSALSAVELAVGLFFSQIFRYDLKNPNHPNNDRFILSKGHASPLLYALWAATGALAQKDLMTLRKFGSPLEGHPTLNFPYSEAALGSLGQGIGIGFGMALNAKIDRLPYRTYVLLGDGEMAEGAVWETLQLAAHYRLDNLIGIIDVNRLEQVGETMNGYDLEAYRKRAGSFGWEPILVEDGHSFPEILAAFKAALTVTNKPVMVIAKTVKGKGVPFLEDKDGWHGKVLKLEELAKALGELGEIDFSARQNLTKPKNVRLPSQKVKPASSAGRNLDYAKGELVSTRQAYGKALVRLFPRFPQMVVLDSGVSNSTYTELFRQANPERFFGMHIAEQNMVGAAIGLSRRGKIPFVSTFAAFLTRAFDQIRMSQYSKANIKFVGSHAGVSIGQDGPSQMGLEDLAMFRSILDSVVLYPADAVATEKLTEEAVRYLGLVYLRLSRNPEVTPVIYDNQEEFYIGGSKTLRESSQDVVTLVATGVTLHQGLRAYEELKKDNIWARVIDLYCLKPIDTETLIRCAQQTKAIITVEDHFPAGGLGEAVMSALAEKPVPIHSLAVRKTPKSGRPEELFDYEEISSTAIIAKVKSVVAA